MQILFLMQKVAICLASAANHGKSTSLKKLVHLFTGEECSEKDIIRIFEYRGLQVGISSRGDTLDCIRPGFDKMVDAKCDIIVCACRTKGTAADYANNTSRNMGYEVIWMGAAYDYGSSFQDICNNQIAYAIKGMIDSIIEIQ